MGKPPAGELEDDAALARAIAQAQPGRAPEAEAELCRRLAPRGRLYGLKHLRDEHAAADLMQQVMMKRMGGGNFPPPGR